MNLNDIDILHIFLTFIFLVYLFMSNQIDKLLKIMAMIFHLLQH